MLGKIGIDVGLQPGAPVSSLRETLMHAEDAGFTHVELSSGTLAVVVRGQLHPGRLAKLQEVLAEVPLSFTLHGSEVSSSRGGNLLDVVSESERQIVASDIELAAAIGATVVVYHSGTLRDPYGDDRALAQGLQRERELLRELGDRAAELGITIAVENRDPVARYIVRRAYGFDLLRLAEQISAVDHPNVKICFDTGHAFLAYTWLGKTVEDYLSDIRQIAPMIGHLHITDNFGQVQLDADRLYSENLSAGDGDLHLLPGWGVIPFEDIFRIPFPLDPIAIHEIDRRYTEHWAEAVEATTRLISLQTPEASQAVAS
jgi:sugar phosphate isomerase/epimerase